MPGYECLNCQSIFYGWGSSDQCPNCGGELQEVNLDNKECPDEENIKKQKDNSIKTTK